MKKLHERRKILLPIVIAITLFAVTPPSNADTINYVYDNLNRLIRIENLTDNKVVEFQYDEVGNRTQKGVYGPLSITANAGEHGSISPSGKVIVLYNSSKSFNLIPDTGYEVLNVQVDGQAQGPLTSYTFNNIITNHTIAGSFTTLTDPVDIGGTTYTTLQAAYDAANNGATIKVRARNITENLNVNRNVSVTLYGGCDVNWNCTSGANTVLKGKIQTYAGGGTLTIRNFMLTP